MYVVSTMNFLQSCWILYILFCLLNFNGAHAQSSCPEIKIPNGYARLKSNGRLINYRCKRNFELVGFKFAVCLTSGQWSQLIPTCVGTTCHRPEVQPPHMIVEELYKGGVLKYTCLFGLTRSGSETLMCDGTKWSDKPPTCTEQTEMGCDFEKEAICGWSHDNSDDFDWMRNSGETLTANTGPRFDHTTNSSTGHYLFMESSAPRLTGQKTRILSSEYAPDKMRAMCMEFFYHMFGPDGVGEVGDLDVYVRPQSMKTSELNNATNIFHRSGNQGDQWIRAEAAIPSQTERFNLVFQAKRLNSWMGDIAIDDIKLYKCSEKTTTMAVPSDRTGDDHPDAKDADPSPRQQGRTTKRSPTITQISNSLTTRKTKPLTTLRLTTSSLAATKRVKVDTTSATSIISTGSKIARSTSAITRKVVTVSNTAKTGNNVESSTISSNTLSSRNAVISQQRTSPKSTITQFLPSVKPTLSNTNNSGNKDDDEKVESAKNSDNNYGVDNINNNNSGNNDKKRIIPPLDYIDNSDEDSSDDRNRSTGVNDTQTPSIDYNYNSNGASFPLDEDDLANDGLIADTGSVNDSALPHERIPFLPLIVGIVASVLVGMVVIAVLAWIWVRSQRQKQEKSHDDHLNIITEYVETNLNN